MFSAMWRIHQIELKIKILECGSYLFETALIAREHKMQILFHFITAKLYCTVLQHFIV